MYGAISNIRSIKSVMTICEVLCRKKAVEESSFGQSNLARVLTTFDLTALGIGSTLGVGIYVLAGELAKTVAGPAVVISFLLAAIASAFTGLCYAEFGARVPKAGSAYVYSYYCVGELAAFFIGWSHILEYVIGAASVARGISTYVDSLLGGKIKDVFLAFAPIEASFMPPYIDFLAFGLCIVLALALASGVRESAIINNFLTFCNLSVVTFIIISGLFKADFANWQVEKKDLPGPEAGEGGFAPFGFVGIIKGAALCFYGFIGFDCIATTGEEVKNPQRAIPLSILTSLTITFLAYFGVSSVLTLMWPYYLQDPDAPFPYVYSQIGWEAAKWFVSIGALFGMFASLFGAMFPIPRIIYAMASDGLLFRILSVVSPKTKVPVLGTAAAGLVTATVAALFNLQQLISLMALGTLLTYTIVAICVLILRYSPDFDDNYKEIRESTGLDSQYDYSGTGKEYFLNYFNCGSDMPTHLTKRITLFNIIIYSAASVAISILIINLKDSNGLTNTSVLTSIYVVGTVMLIAFFSMCSQPKSQKSLPFQMPLVPLLPCLSIFLNVYLMFVLDLKTWIKLMIWMCTGIIPYLCWYYWKFRHGQLGENSRYNINRVNNIKLNELVWKLVCEKKTLIDGYTNEGFDSDSRLDVRENQVQSSNIDKIHVSTDTVLEFVEINNNVFPAKKAEDELLRSVAEVHAVVHEEEKEMDKQEEKTNEEVGNERAAENASVPDADAEPELTSDEKPKLYIIDESPKENQMSEGQIFGPDIPIRKRINPQPRVILNIDRKSLQSLPKNGPRTVAKVEGTSSGDTTGVVKTKLRVKGFDSELLHKLNKIIGEQASFVQSGLKKSSVLEDTSNKPGTKQNGNYVDVKTLTKTEIMSKLQHLLEKGPPKKPSFMSVLKPAAEEVNGEENGSEEGCLEVEQCKV